MKYLLIIFFICLKVSAQNVKYSNKKNSIFIFFDENLRYDDLNLKKNSSKKNTLYQFKYPDAKTIEFLTYDQGNLANENICKPKSFLINNSDRTLSIDDFKNLGYRKTLDSISNKSLILFIIDKKDFKRKKLKLKRAYLKTFLESEI